MRLLRAVGVFYLSFPYELPFFIRNAFQFNLFHDNNGIFEISCKGIRVTAFVKLPYTVVVFQCKGKWSVIIIQVAFYNAVVLHGVIVKQFIAVYVSVIPARFATVDSSHVKF